MIGILLSDQSFEQDIRELLMAFCPGQKFTHDEGEALREAGLIVRGGRTGSGFWLSAERSVSEAENQDGAGTETGPRRFEPVSEGRITVDEDSRFETKNRLKRELYQMMSRLTGKELPWGTLTGIRPTKIALTRLYEGASEQEIHDHMKETYLTSEEKIALSLDVARREKELLSVVDYENGYSLYIGIPFCPTTCLYCSFTSFPIGKWQGRTELYLNALFWEMEYVAEKMRGRVLDTIYFGGGTPTSLSPEDLDAPAAFRQSTRLSQHISFLRDFFRSYKSFTDRQIDVIEIMVGRLYERWGISDSTDFSRLSPEDYPILSDLYALIEQEYRNFDEGKYQLYTAAILQEILLGLHSMCKGAESKFFNGHTNVTSSRFVVFGVKGLLQASKNVRSAMLFNVLSYLSDKLLTEGNTVAALDELYIWLSDNVAVGTTIIEYIRNCLKRVRKKESAMLLASQNLEDFNQEGIRELTKPLFAIPPHQFLFNAGAVDKKFYMEALQLEESEYNLIRFPQRGVCLYRCGNERYLLEVHAPAYKEALFGKAGGR